MIDIEYNSDNIKKIIPLISECRNASEDLATIAIDIEKSIANCGLTREQNRIVMFMMSGRFKQREISNLIGKSNSSVSSEYKKACEKICNYINKCC